MTKKTLRILFLFPSFPHISQISYQEIIGELIKRGHSIRIMAFEPSDSPVRHPVFQKHTMEGKTIYVFGKKNRPFSEKIPLLSLHTLLKLYTRVKHIVSCYLYNPCSFVYLAFLSRYQKPYFFSPPVLAGAASCYQDYEGPFDIIHATTYYSSMALGGILKKAGFAKRLVSSFGSLADIPSHHPTYPAIYQQIRMTFMHSDTVTFQSQALEKQMKSYIASLGFQKKVPTQTLYYGLNIKTLPSDHAHEKTEIPADSPSKHFIHILTVARLVEEKGLPYALQAMKVLKQKGYRFRYHIVGEGVLEKPLKAIASALGLQSIVEWYPFMPHDQVFEKMRTSDIFLLPSIQEGFSMVLLEAQAADLPIVATNSCGIPEAVFPDKSAFLVPVGDIPAMVQRLEQLLCDPPLRKTMGEAGHNFVLSRFTVEQTVDQLEPLYYKLLLKNPVNVS